MATKFKPETKESLEAKKFLADVPPEFVFWSHDGRVFKNVRELSDGLMTMSEDIYAFHANKERNDFKNWVKDVIGDTRLANDLQKASSRNHAAMSVKARIIQLNKQVQ
jgi:hypothetical protein